MNNPEEILDKPCFICGKLNRFHKVFWSPATHNYVRQSYDTDWNGELLVPSADHYASINNLEFLEYRFDHRGIKENHKCVKCGVPWGKHSFKEWKDYHPMFWSNLEYLEWKYLENIYDKQKTSIQPNS